MTASVAGGYARSRVKRLFQPAELAAEERRSELLRAGGRIAATLGELKGAAMKMGQMASVVADLLPKELAGALQSLQRQAPPVDFSVIEAQIVREFDQPIARLFEEFDPTPFAAASIGQVHRARLEGREVICKVQYPGVDGAVDSDMRHLKLALLASGVLRVDKRALDAAFDEISARMHEELDYCNESDNVRAFRAFHRRHPFVIVPEVIRHRSAKRVLTLAYVPGDHVRDFDALGYSQAERDLCADNLWTAIASQIFDHGCIHADPNPANFAYRKDGSVIIYDFGCVKRLAPGISDSCKALVEHSVRENYAEVDRALQRLGVRKPDGAAVPPDYYKRWRDWLTAPLLAAETFDFGAARFERELLNELLPESLKHLHSFQPSREMVFLNRSLVGHYAQLRAMRANVRVRARLAQRVPAAFARGDAR
jgi:predicted unusual protein kinase regulating ubiquinone biosynthesis (AarF/ABC1/UbiB family)